MMSFWTFSDVFEEGGPIPNPFEGHFGLRAKGGINKPSFYDFALLHRLGTKRLKNDSPNAIVTQRDDGTFAIALWNLVDPGVTGKNEMVTLQFPGALRSQSAKISRVDNDHGNTLAAYRALGSPAYPTPEQVEALNRETALGEPERQNLTRGKLTLTLAPNALVLVEVPRP